MSPLRAAVAALAIVVSVVLQSTVLAGLPLPGPTPDLVLLAVIGVALASGANTGAVTGFAAGLLLAVAPPADAPLGLAAMLYCLVGYVVGSRAAGERLAWTEVAAVAAAAGALIAAATVLLGGLWGQGWPGAVAALLIVVLQASYCALLAGLVAPAVSTIVAAVPGRA